MPGSMMHENVSIQIQMLIGDAIQRLALIDRIYRHYELDVHASAKWRQPDMGWGPRRQRDSSPSVALETAESVSPNKLRQLVDYWLDPTRGNINLVIVLRASRHRHLICIDKLIWDPVHSTGQIIQHIVISRRGKANKPKVFGGPLVIPFDMLLLRAPQNPGEADLIIDDEPLGDIAMLGWRLQSENRYH